MADLLLITDNPRIRNVFMRLAGERNLALRVAGSLEKGAEEIVSGKPAMVFVQTHLSGLSADILLMHLKKLLGRRRTRFVLLSPGDQVSDTVIKLFQGYVDTSLDEQPLLDAIVTTVAALTPKGKKAGAAQLKKGETVAAPDRREVAEPLHEEPAGVVAGTVAELSRPEPAVQAPESAEPVATDAAEPSLEEQGVVYAPRPRMSVYSEFTGAFDSAVNDIRETELPETPPVEQTDAWKNMRTESVGAAPPRSRSKWAAFLWWAVPLVVAVIGITLWQYRGSTPESVNLTPASPVRPAGKPAPSSGESAKAPASIAPVTQAGAVKPQVAETGGHPGDKAAQTQTGAAESRSHTQQGAPTAVAPRPAALPGFIPRTGFDKEYGAANPGWERYKGVVTEFKVFREGAAIKAIQVIDRGGRGIPDAFVNSALAQLAKTPTYTQTSQEKKEGYEIQRGQVAGNLNVVFYRDARGGKLRAFAVTWQ